MRIHDAKLQLDFIFNESMKFISKTKIWTVICPVTAHKIFCLCSRHLLAQLSAFSPLIFYNSAHVRNHSHFFTLNVCCQNMEKSFFPKFPRSMEKKVRLRKTDALSDSPASTNFSSVSGFLCKLFINMPLQPHYSSTHNSKEVNSPDFSLRRSKEFLTWI